MATSGTSAIPGSDEIAALKAQLNAKDALIAILEEKLRLATHQQFAPASEKLSSLGQIVNRHRTLTPDRRAILTPLLCCLPMWQW